MKLLTLIPARGGSKRLPGKNVRLLGGKPLIVWTIDAAKKCIGVGDILASTDDPEILSICQNSEVLAPWLRPSILSTDTASSVDVALHALEWYESVSGHVDGLLLLQPTSPFRTSATIKRGIELFKLNAMNQVIGVSECNPDKDSMGISDDGYLLINGPNRYKGQHPSMEYRVNGSFYLSSPSDLRKYNSFKGDRTVPLIIESEIEALDIDLIEDFELAERALKNGQYH